MRPDIENFFRSKDSKTTKKKMSFQFTVNSREPTGSRL